tara:strand:+ start:3895 stop:4647 length:753 start_codon:yes stop_codon:yes gene_type:complete
MSNSLSCISVVIIAKNSESIIKRCLNSLIDFREVILYLNDCDDKTKVVASSYQNVKIFEGSFTGFANTKKKAISYASNDWILSIDSDEVLSASLVNSLKQVPLNTNTVYSFQRISYYKKKKIKFSGLYNEQVVRLFNKQTTNFDNSLVHEKVNRTDLSVVVLNGYIDHFTYLSISDLIQKTDSYSTLYSNQHTKKSSPLIAIVKSLFFFIKTYIFRLGFLDGYVGFLIAYSGSTGVFYKYLKLYEKNDNL